MAVVSTKKNRPHRMRRWAYAPLVAVVAAGAVCTGAGVGSAATDPDPRSSVAATVSDDLDTAGGGDALAARSSIFTLTYNHTREPVWGNVRTVDYSGWVQNFEWTKEDPLLPELSVDAASTEQREWSPSPAAASGAFTSASLCYNGSWWVLNDQPVFRIDLIPSPDNPNDLAADLDGVRTKSIHKVGECG
ncbi:hypothetical protein [Rhodococcus jostii]|uniref:hypothetical protein n=1 Tax=Rhodococcus jostii TaxID=132919 RepID=UPI0036264B47